MHNKEIWNNLVNINHLMNLKIEILPKYIDN